MANIPYSGFNGAIATYTADTCISITSVTDNASWITVSSGNSTINGNVQANTTLSSRTATVTVGYKADATDCSKSFNVTQDARPCNCGDLTISPTALTWTNTSTDKKTVTISSATNATCLSNLSVSVAPTGHFNASISGNKIEITPTTANTTTSPITATVTFSYKASSTNCSSAITLTHSATACDCGMLTLSPTSLNWAYSATSANSSSVTISKDACITNISVASSTNFTASLSNDNITVYPNGQNTRTSDLNEVIYVSYSANGLSCTSGISVSQGNSGSCGCNSVTFVETSRPLDSGGTPSSGAAIATYDFNGCSGEIVSGTSNVSWLKFLNGNNNKIYVSAQTNSNLEDRSGTTTVYYKANSTDTSLCSKNFDVSQLSVNCDCGSLEYFVTPIKLEFGSEGSRGQRILIASADTHGCGSLSASTSAEMFGKMEGGVLVTGGTIETEYIDATQEKAYFYVYVMPYEPQGDYDTRSAAGNIYFKLKGESSTIQCTGEVLRVYQKPKIIGTCEDYSIEPPYPVSADCDFVWYDGSGPTLLRVVPNKTDVSTKIDSANYVYIRIDNQDNWFTTYARHGYNSYSVSLETVQPNYSNSASARTGTLEYSIVIHQNKNGQNTTTVCSPSSSVTFVQSGCSCFDCSKYSFDAELSTILSDLPSSSGEVSLLDYLNYPSDCADALAEIDIVSASTSTIPSTFAYDSTTKVLSYSANPSSSSKEFDINFGIQIGGDVCWHEFSVYQNNSCPCENFTLNVIGNDGSCSAHDVVIEYQGKGSSCGPFISAVTECSIGSYSMISSITTSSTSVTLHLTENDTQYTKTCSATTFIAVPTGNPGGTVTWVRACESAITITQAPCCVCGYSSVSSTGTVWSDLGETTILTFTHDPCVTYSAYTDAQTEASGLTITQAEYGTTSYVYAEYTPTTPSAICISDVPYYVAFTKVGESEPCEIKTRSLTLIGNCAGSSPSSGSLSQTVNTITGDGQTSYSIATLTNSKIGSSDYACTELVLEPQDWAYFNSISASSTINGSSVDYIISVVPSLYSGDGANVRIDVKRKYTSPCDSSDVSLFTIGTLELLINKP